MSNEELLAAADDAGGVSIQSASGCNLNVCIDVRGQSLLVYSWSTTAFGNVGCLNAYYYAYGGIFIRSPLICPDSPNDGVYFSVYNPDTTWRDGTKLCNKWFYAYSGGIIASISGNPCIYIRR